MPAEQSRVAIEVCVESVASAIAAERGGASRIELCSGLIEGGITPSVGLIESVRNAVSLPMHVMVRPRGGDFCYDADEFAIMQREIAQVKKLGVNGLVFGILTLAGDVDVGRTRELVEMSRPLAVTFHRAFDMTRDLFLALNAVRSTGANRVLTSGGEQTALQGSKVIAELVKQADGAIVVMPGSGIKPENAQWLIQETGATEIHVGMRTSLPSPMQHRNTRVTMGSIEGREYQRSVVREEDIRRLCAALSHA